MAELPTKAQILDWIAENPGQTAKRDIARAFGIKGSARIDLKRMLRELEDEGHLDKRKGQRPGRRRRPVGEAARLARRGARAAHPDDPACG
jgi:ribonuclease R